MRGAEEVTFGGSGLDRAGHLRGRPDEIARLLEAPGTAILVLWRGKPLVRGTGPELAAAWVAPGHPVLAEAAEPPVFLGLDDRTDAPPRAVFAADISGWDPGETAATLGAFADPSEQRHPALPEDERFVELRGAMAMLAPRDAELLATARAVTGWHATHRFCARCGAASLPAQAGWQRDCPACGGHHFPRTDPVVIALITHGQDVLLGRSPGWPEGMYSLLAGFVEPGETIEAAVRREVFEEAGVRVGEVGYLASQPWPFPASLMFGCRGTALTREIVRDPGEIEDALWLPRQDLLEVFEGRHPRVRAPRRGAIAGFLLGRWLADRLD